MSINEDIVALRKKMVEAVRIGFLDEETKGTYEMTLLQIMNESDRQRRNCANRAEQLKMQAATAEGQAAAFGMISSIINNVVGSMVGKTAQMLQEEKELAEREAAAKAEAEAEVEAAKTAKKKTTRKTTRKTRTKRTDEEQE